MNTKPLIIALTTAFLALTVGSSTVYAGASLAPEVAPPAAAQCLRAEEIAAKGVDGFLIFDVALLFPSVTDVKMAAAFWVGDQMVLYPVDENHCVLQDYEPLKITKQEFQDATGIAVGI